MRMRGLILTLLATALIAGCSDSTTTISAQTEHSAETRGLLWDAPVLAPEAGATSIELSGDAAQVREVLRYELESSASASDAGTPRLALQATTNQQGVTLNLPEGSALEADRTYSLVIHYGDDLVQYHSIKPRKAVRVAGSLGTISCADSSARSDSLLKPNFMVVEPGVNFTLPVKGDPPADLRVSLSQTDGLGVLVDLDYLEGQLIISPRHALKRGCAYELVLRWSSESALISVGDAGASSEREQRLMLFVRRTGVLFASEADMDGDFLPDRVAIDADGGVMVESAAYGVLAVEQPSLREVSDASVADLDRDGFADLVLIGFDEDNTPRMEVLFNRSYEGVPRFERESSELVVYSDSSELDPDATISEGSARPSKRVGAGVRLPLALSLLDLRSDGWLDICVGGFEGSLLVFSNSRADGAGMLASRQAFSRSLWQRMPAGFGALVALEQGDVNRDGHADLLLSGSKRGALALGSNAGLRFDGALSIPSDGASLYAMRDGARTHVVGVSPWSVERFELQPDGLSFSTSVMFDGVDHVTAFWCFNSADYDRNHYTDFALAYQESTDGTLHRWLQYASGFDASGHGVSLGHAARVNRVTYAAASESLLLCAEDGLVEVSLLGASPQSSTLIRYPNKTPALYEAQADLTVLADLDGDGRQDFASSYRDAPHTFKVWLNPADDADATLKVSLRSSALPVCEKLLVIKDRSGAPTRDRLLLVPADASRSVVLLELAAESGQFRWQELLLDAELLKALQRSPSVYVRDFNGDGRFDLVFEDAGLFVSFAVDEGFSPAQELVLQWPEPIELESLHGLALADSPAGAERDAWLAVARTLAGDELAVLIEPDAPRSSLRPSCLATPLAGAFKRVQEVTSGELVSTTRGFAALVEDDQGVALVVWADLFAEPALANRFAQDEQPRSLALADADGNRAADVCMLIDRRASGPAMHLTAFMNPGLGAEGLQHMDAQTFTAMQISRVTQAETLSFALLQDVNGDSLPDVVIRTQHGQLLYALGE